MQFGNISFCSLGLLLSSDAATAVGRQSVLVLRCMLIQFRHFDGHEDGRKNSVTAEKRRQHNHQVAS